MEAMACGCAVVASDVGETRRLISDQNGKLVPLEAMKIANVLSDLLDNFEDTVLMGEIARRKVLREHNITRYLKYVEGLYEKATVIGQK